MILMYEFHFVFLELDLGQTIISDYPLTFFGLICHSIIFLEFDANFFLPHFDLLPILEDFHFVMGSIVHHFSLDEIKCFIYHYCLSIYYFLYFVEVYLMLLCFTILIRNFFNIMISRLFEQFIVLFKLLFQSILSQFYNN